MLNKPTIGEFRDTEGRVIDGVRLGVGKSVDWLPPIDQYGDLKAFSMTVADALGQARGECLLR